MLISTSNNIAMQAGIANFDERESVYTVDRFSGGLYILEMDF